MYFFSALGIGRLVRNIDALLCRMYLYQGEKAFVDEWMKQAPDEDHEFFGMERYRYLTKIRVYIANGKYQKALLLIEKMVFYAEEAERTYIKMELHILKAIIMFRMENDEWKMHLEKAYVMAEDYHFVRIFSTEGSAILPLFYKAKLPIINGEFYDKVLAETENMNKLYPSYLKTSDADQSFSENAIRILRYQAEGMTNEEIAEILEVNIGTVKYHCKENYKKLGVKSKAAAVSEARKRKLI